MMSYFMSGAWWTSYGILNDKRPVYSAVILTDFLMPDIKYATAHEFPETLPFDIFSAFALFPQRKTSLHHIKEFLHSWHFTSSVPPYLTPLSLCWHFQIHILKVWQRKNNAAMNDQTAGHFAVDWWGKMRNRTCKPPTKECGINTKWKPKFHFRLQTSEEVLEVFYIHNALL